MRALVIGADGFAGRWLIRHLAESGDSVIAGVGPNFVPPLPTIQKAISVDVQDARSVDAIVEQALPEITYYLAGITQRDRRDDIRASAAVSVSGSVHVLTSLNTYAPNSRLLFVSSGYVYGSSTRPQSEGAPAAPLDSYGAVKLATEEALQRLAPITSIELLIARPFNHIGPGQRGGFLIPSVAVQLRRISEGQTDRLSGEDR